MRNFLLVCFAFMLGLGATTVSAQTVCTPDQLATLAGIPGLYPLPTNALNNGSQGSPYSQTITLIVPSDTTIDFSTYVPGAPTVSASVNYQEVTGLSGLPTGLTYQCETSNCQWTGGSNGCIKISGTPTQSGSFTVSISTGINVTVPNGIPVIGGAPLTIPIPGISWPMEVTATGIKDQVNSDLTISPNAPNPFHGSTTISFDAVKPANVQFVVTDLTGKVMHSEDVRANLGANKILFDASALAAGIYLYRLSMNGNSVTSKMMVE